MNRLDADAPEPNVAGHFSSWVPWRDRLTIPDGHSGHVHDYGGVYLLAHFRGETPAGAADLLDDAIVYVGEGGHLKRRWYDFERSAHVGVAGHSGGHSHRRWREETGTAWETLQVAAFPIWFASEGDTDAPASLARRFRLYVEQSVLWKLAGHRRGLGRNLALLNVK
jgi:hypothetical protein